MTAVVARTPRRRIRWRGVLLGLAVGLVVAAFAWRPVARAFSIWAAQRVIARAFPAVPQWPTAEVAARLDQVQLLDVREPVEHAVSHLPGARQVAPDADPAELVRTLDPARPAVLYCSLGYRSSLLAERLIAAGFTNVANLRGCIFVWAAEGRPIESNGVPARVVHPYSPRFAFLLPQDLAAEVPPAGE
ncbi:MAG TPA: rhodanese-like domain-containing protein [Verrucomicrobiota bacterium]|nr:rhodanese-like domain-containing protein [Verrucomicrobiota bacterium]